MKILWEKSNGHTVGSLNKYSSYGVLNNTIVTQIRYLIYYRSLLLWYWYKRKESTYPNYQYIQQFRLDAIEVTGISKVVSEAVLYQFPIRRNYCRVRPGSGLFRRDHDIYTVQKIHLMNVEELDPTWSFVTQVYSCMYF